MEKDETRYRVFISYSHEDRDKVEKIDAVLKDKGLVPVWDKDFSFGIGFPEQIKTFIAHSHVFLPVISAQSSMRGWVHQEIGYAMALNVPVLPLVIGSGLPGEMMQQLLAVRLPENLEGLETRLSYQIFHNLVGRYRDFRFAVFHCAELTEERAQFMAEYARDVLAMEACGRVRQKGALSSFHIPDKRIAHPVWRQRYGRDYRSEHHCQLQREERQALEAHARLAGCRIIVDPSLKYREYGPEARKVRLGCLLEFLESDAVPDVEVAINKGMPPEQSVTIVGDWFYSESVAGVIGKGYRQTIFTRHAPSMQSKIDQFDVEFEELLKERRWTAESSRKAAIAHLKKTMALIKTAKRGKTLSGPRRAPSANATRGDT